MEQKIIHTPPSAELEGSIDHFIWIFCRIISEVSLMEENLLIIILIQKRRISFI